MAEAVLTWLRSKAVAQLREEFQLPVLPLPQGVPVHATIARVEKVDASRHWAVAVGKDAVHLVRVPSETQGLVGKQVELRQDGGIVQVKSRELGQGLQR